VVGPLFYYDLIRLARRGRYIPVRAGYALFLMIVIYLTHADRLNRWELSLSPGEMARFGEQIVQSFLLWQNLAVILITPFFVAGTIVEERERGTLDLLFTTFLTDREILVGKLWSRLAQVAGLLLAGLPILALIQFWGGVNMQLVVAGFIATAGNLLSVGSLCLFCSVSAHSLLGAVVFSYFAIFALGSVCCTPFICAFSVGFALPVAIVLFVIQSAGALSFFSSAIAELRRRRGRLPFGSVAEMETAVKKAAEGQAPVASPLESEAPERTPLRSPPVSERPLVWRELHFGASIIDGAVARGIVAIAVTVIVCFLAIVYSGVFADVGPRAALAQLREFLVGPVGQALWVVTLGTYCVGVAVSAAGSVVTERVRDTLDGLLMLPCARRDILVAKWVGAVVRLRYLAYFAAFLGLLVLVLGGLTPASLILLLFAGTTHVAFAASLGLFLSVYCKSILWAHVGTVVALAGWLIGTMYLLPGLNPVIVWRTFSFGWPNQEKIPETASEVLSIDTLLPTVEGLALHLLVAGVLWLATVTRFAHK
jgi:ABC-type transport system involved in multi-copper enzyme maturation permease subunit